MKMVHQKTKTDSLVGLEDLCEITMYFNNNIYILQPRQPEVRIEQWVRFRFKNQEVCGSNSKLDR